LNRDLEDHLVRRAQERHEFVQGEIRAMAGTTLRHGEIQAALAGAIRRGLPPGCRAYEGNIKLWVELPNDVAIFYPDIFVFCGNRDPKSHFLKDAGLIVEVLSESTETVDRGEKFEAYKNVPSLQTYVLVAQDTLRIEVFRRRRAWAVETYLAGQDFTLDGVSTPIAVDEVYRDTQAET
jgi:Uma2 family endonuclease